MDAGVIGKSFVEAGRRFVMEEREGDPPVARQFFILEKKYGLDHLSKWSDHLIDTCAAALVENFQLHHGNDEVGQDMPPEMVPDQIAFQLKIIRQAAIIKLANENMSAADCVKEAFSMLRG